MIKRTTIIEIITVLNIILFLYTGIAKIMDYSLFKEQLADSPILSFAATPVALFLPWAELIVVLLLIIPKWRLKGFYCSFTLMILFTAYIIALLSTSKKMICSCGKVIELLSWKQHVMFNTSIIALNLLSILLYKREKKNFNKYWENKDTYNISHS